jgi:hypothetical protein
MAAVSPGLRAAVSPMLGEGASEAGRKGGKGREGSKNGRESAAGKGNKGSECYEFGWESAEGGEEIKIKHGGEAERNVFGRKSADGEGIKHGRESAVGKEGKYDRESGDCASRESGLGEGSRWGGDSGEGGEEKGLMGEEGAMGGTSAKHGRSGPSAGGGAATTPTPSRTCSHYRCFCSWWSRTEFGRWAPQHLLRGRGGGAGAGTLPTDRQE